MDLGGNEDVKLVLLIIERFNTNYGITLCLDFSFVIHILVVVVLMGQECFFTLEFFKAKFTRIVLLLTVHLPHVPL